MTVRGDSASRSTPDPYGPAAGASVGVRIGDTERERAVRDLGEHFAAGRLTPDELDERLGQAWNAKTAADLRPLFADLPGPTALAQPERGPVSRPVAARDRRSGPPFGFPLPLLPILAMVIGLTVLTHVPFLLFFLGGLLLVRALGGGCHGRQPHALRR